MESDHTVPVTTASNFAVIKGRTSKQTHIALAFRCNQKRKKTDYKYIDGKYQTVVLREYTTDMAFTACGFYLETTGKLYRMGDKLGWQTHPTCQYCSGYLNNVREIEKGDTVSPEEYIAQQ